MFVSPDVNIVVAQMITELICFQPKVCIWKIIRNHERICICNEGLSENISTDLSL